MKGWQGRDDDKGRLQRNAQAAHPAARKAASTAEGAQLGAWESREHQITEIDDKVLQVE